jgi:peptide/nickel transport system permease protein
MNKIIKHSVYVITENPVSLVAFVLMFCILFVGIFGSALAPSDPYHTDPSLSFKPPSSEHWFGTDQLGRDILSRVITATRIDLIIAFSAVMLSFFIGGIIGGISGFFGGRLDMVLGRLFDILMAFPLFVLAMALVAALGNEIVNIVYATAVINLPFYYRLSRTEVNVKRSLPYSEAALVSGNTRMQVLFRFLLPNALPPMLVTVSLNMGWAILNAAGLSFIGLGIRPPTAEWGIMVAEGATQIISGYWWTALFPGLALTITVFCFNLLGDSLRDIFDPRMRS